MKTRSFAIVLIGAVVGELLAWWSYSALGSFGDLGPINAVGTAGTIFHSPGLFLADWMKAKDKATTILCILCGMLEWALLLTIVLWAVRRAKRTTAS